MSAPPESTKTGFATFRLKVLVAMMLIVSGVAALALYFGERSAAANVERDLQREFHAQVAALDHLQQIRRAALVERCRALVRKPRIHAALEDNALDLLYLSANDELRDVMERAPDLPDHADYVLRARFYRFLDRQGRMILPPSMKDVGDLSPEEEAQLALNAPVVAQQVGYLVNRSGGKAELSEVVAMPIQSSETGERIAAIVLGFKPHEVGGVRLSAEIKSGIWLNDELYLTSLTSDARDRLHHELSVRLAHPELGENSFGIQINDTPHLLFYKRLNPESQYAPAYEVCVYPLTELLTRQRRLRWQIFGTGAFLLMGSLLASHFVAGTLSRPVEKLAIDSAENQLQRERAEAALEMTSAELQRSARFSADASHQLKTPVTVLRAGLEELLARPSLTPDESHEIAALVHQTFRLASVIEDLLLLSRMDAGRLTLDFSPVNLSQLIDGWLDDLAALPDPLELSVETNYPAHLYIAGEKRYTTLILQNLLENSRKYNRPEGRIRITAWPDRGKVYLVVGNTGTPIPTAAQEHVFERFHRGSVGENLPGHGLGLNLARELARIHKGDLRLASSGADWTEFEVAFEQAEAPALLAGEPRV